MRLNVAHVLVCSIIAPYRESSLCPQQDLQLCHALVFRIIYERAFCSCHTSLEILYPCCMYSVWGMLRASISRSIHRDSQGRLLDTYACGHVLQVQISP